MLPTFTMDKRGNYAAYLNGTFTGYMIYRNGGDMLPTDVFYKGERVATVRSLDTAKHFVIGKVFRNG